MQPMLSMREDGALKNHFMINMVHFFINDTPIVTARNTMMSTANNTIYWEWTNITNPNIADTPLAISNTTMTVKATLSIVFFTNSLI